MVPQCRHRVGSYADADPDLARSDALDGAVAHVQGGLPGPLRGAGAASPSHTHTRRLTHILSSPHPSSLSLPPIWPPNLPKSCSVSFIARMSKGGCRSLFGDEAPPLPRSHTRTHAHTHARTHTHTHTHTRPLSSSLLLSFLPIPPFLMSTTALHRFCSSNFSFCY